MHWKDALTSSWNRTQTENENAGSLSRGFRRRHCMAKMNDGHRCHPVHRTWGRTRGICTADVSVFGAHLPCGARSSAARKSARCHAQRVSIDPRGEMLEITGRLTGESDRCRRHDFNNSRLMQLHPDAQRDHHQHRGHPERRASVVCLSHVHVQQHAAEDGADAASEAG
jgi:hypothetical protein